MTNPLERLVRVLARLPGIGRRTAERIAMRLAYRADDLLSELTSAMGEVKEKVGLCSLCGAVTTVDVNPCSLCVDNRRDQSVLCVVEDPGDVTALELAGGFTGRYHVLMGKISPMSGKGPWDLRLKELVERIDREQCRELVLALNTNTESDATVAFIRDLLKGRQVKITRLALGLPVGSGVSYSDPVTLERAMRGRQAV
ncbi:MAG: recombination protein RecR [Lentisphaerales bacterium]|jgi:recombination protein RecR|nr:MAG: recombination protein RecR [Lentisphaerales bacterium]